MAPRLRKSKTARRLKAAIDDFVRGTRRMAEVIVEVEALRYRLEAVMAEAEAEAHQQDGGSGGTQAATGEGGDGSDGGDGALTPQHHASRSRSRSR